MYDQFNPNPPSTKKYMQWRKISEEEPEYGDIYYIAQDSHNQVKLCNWTYKENREIKFEYWLPKNEMDTPQQRADDSSFELHTLRVALEDLKKELAAEQMKRIIAENNGKSAEECVDQWLAEGTAISVPVAMGGDNFMSPNPTMDELITGKKTELNNIPQSEGYGHNQVISTKSLNDSMLKQAMKELKQLMGK